jgi:hypothetical protein
MLVAAREAPAVQGPRAGLALFAARGAAAVRDGCSPVRFTQKTLLHTRSNLGYLRSTFATLTRGPWLSSPRWCGVGQVTVMALGGSTNAVLHLIAIARSVGINLTLDDFQVGNGNSGSLRGMRGEGGC